jgi:cbb3-type cytochrome oxidase maturation protein
MSVLYVALPIAIAMGAAAMWACIRCIRSGQFDDLESPAVRMLIDEQPKTTKPHRATIEAAKAAPPNAAED